MDWQRPYEYSAAAKQIVQNNKKRKKPLTNSKLFWLLGWERGLLVFARIVEIIATNTLADSSRNLDAYSRNDARPSALLGLVACVPHLASFIIGIVRQVEEWKYLKALNTAPEEEIEGEDNDKA